MAAAGHSIRLPVIAVRVGMVALSAAAITWTVLVLPGCWSQQRLNDIAAHIIAGDVYKPAIFEGMEARLARDQTLSERSSSLSKIAIVHLRGAELAIAAGDRDHIDSSLESLHRSIANALANAPSDPFLWLIRFWVENTREGLKSENLRLLRMSYRRGPYEGWIAVKRSRFALALFGILPADLSEEAISEFVRLVRSPVFAKAAADIVAGPGWPIRHMLLAQLKGIGEQERSYFARLLYERNVDDVSVPNVQPQQQRP